MHPKTLASLLAAAALAACGGGGASAPTTAASSGPPATAAAQGPAASACAGDDAPAAANPTARSLSQATGATVSAHLPQGVVEPMHVLQARLDGDAPRDPAGTGPWGAQDLRAMYGLPAVAADLGSLGAAERAALGEGQTVYVIVVYHDWNVFSHLARYAQDNGLPACTPAAIDGRTPLPLPAAGAGCSVAAVGADADGNVAELPDVGFGWTEEEALDLEMAHAAAPLARLVVVAARDNTLQSLAGAVALANRMGPGVVSMSLAASDGAGEQAWDSLFAAPGMLYVAASGDQGGGGAPAWPAVVPTVLAVGGTTVHWNGATRTETAWPSSGGGVSALRAVPAYQAGYALREGAHCVTPAGRMTPDVSAVADRIVIHATGPQGFGDYPVSGTSAGTPFWAGLLASANAIRRASGRPALTDVHRVLYERIGAQQAAYGSAFYDVAAGASGPCTGCASTAGFDLSTGLGTPRGAGLLAALAGS